MNLPSARLDLHRAELEQLELRREALHDMIESQRDVLRYLRGRARQLDREMRKAQSKPLGAA